MPRQMQRPAAFYVYGVFLIGCSALFFMLTLFNLTVAKFLPLDGKHPILDALINDRYYCYLIPLTIPTSVVFIYANWVSLKFFRHN